MVAVARTIQPGPMQPLAYDDYRLLAPYFAGQPYRLCAYSLSSILVWRNSEVTPVFAVVDGRVVVGAEFATLTDRRHLLLPVGGPEPGPRQLADIAQALGFSAFGFVPQDYLERHGKAVIQRWFSVEHQPEFDDYIYRQDDLARLKGNRYSKKRNLIHQFERRYVHAGRVTAGPIGPDDVDECLEFLEQWCRQAGCEEADDLELACEKQAAANALVTIDRLAMEGIQVRIDGQVKGFGLGSRLTDRMGVLHFEKADSRIKGLYQFLDRECARRLFGDVAWINKESDMGVENLARAKRSYHPCCMERAYRLVLHR